MQPHMLQWRLGDVESESINTAELSTSYGQSCWFSSMQPPQIIPNNYALHHHSRYLSVIQQTHPQHLLLSILCLRLFACQGFIIHLLVAQPVLDISGNTPAIRSACMHAYHAMRAPTLSQTRTPRSAFSTACTSSGSSTPLPSRTTLFRDLRCLRCCTSAIVPCTRSALYRRSRKCTCSHPGS